MSRTSTRKPAGVEGGGLVLARKVGEAVLIGKDVRVVVLEIQSDRVRLRFAAPEEVQIDREEVRARLLNGEEPRVRRRAS